MQSTVLRFLERYQIRIQEAGYFQLCRVARSFSNIPYENVTKILKESRTIGSQARLRLTEEVLADHLRWGTGGTCFSLCNALKDVLDQCNFEAQIAMADMAYGSNIHCAVVAKVAGRLFLLDPGYLLHEPIAVPDAGIEIMKKTAMNTVFLQNENRDVHSLHTLEGEKRKWRYRLRTSVISREEFIGHWSRSFSLNSMENLMLTRLSEFGRHYFRKDRLELVNPMSRQKRILTAAEFPELSSIFGVPSDLISMAQKALLARPLRAPQN
jgi:arylamine N-acetyltransferase